ncbi:MAG: MFS transporter, partial [Campylobacter sp.]|nr:MFS transporter [Campylobacter sp.]
MILLPFIFLFSPSGFINDKFSKTKVIRIAAIVAVGISFLIFLSYAFGFFWIAFGLTIVLAAQSAIYSPAKYSIIKLIVGTENLGVANGIIQALTIVAILFSSFAFSFMFESYYVASSDPNEILRNISIVGILLVILSTLEAFFTFKLPYFTANPEEKEIKFSMKRYFTLKYLIDNLKIVKADKNIWLSIIGLSLFWGVSQIIVAAFPAHYKIVFSDENTVVIQGILAMSGVG